MNDFEKALAVAILSPCAAYIGQLLLSFSQGGTFIPDWNMLLKFALAGGVGYLTKNLGTNSQGLFLKPEVVPAAVPPALPQA